MIMRMVAGAQSKVKERFAGLNLLSHLLLPVAEEVRNLIAPTQPAAERQYGRGHIRVLSSIFHQGWPVRCIKHISTRTIYRSNCNDILVSVMLEVSRPIRSLAIKQLWGSNRHLPIERKECPMNPP